MNRREVVGGLSAAGAMALAGFPNRAAAVAKRDAFTIIPRDAHDKLGEGIIWSARHNAIFWVDIEQPTLWMMDYTTGGIRSWPMPELICWIVERKDHDDFIVGMRSGFCTLKLDPLEIKLIGNLEPGVAGNRMNDAKVDRWGRIWAGTMGKAGGSLYRIDPDLTSSRQDTGYQVTNGPTFSPDGNIMYHNDTPRRLVYAMDMNADGRLTNKRVFIKFEEEWGVPDGMTTDAEGYLWICCWDGSRISRFRPDGTLDRFISLPATRITNCVFAGPKLGTLFVNSATTGTSGQKDAGSLFRLQPGAKGLLANKFAG